MITVRVVNFELLGADWNKFPEISQLIILITCNVSIW